MNDGAVAEPSSCNSFGQKPSSGGVLWPEYLDGPIIQTAWSLENGLGARYFGPNKWTIVSCVGPIGSTPFPYINRQSMKSADFVVSGETKRNPAQELNFSS